MRKVIHIITGLGQGGAERMLHRIVQQQNNYKIHSPLVISLSNAGFYGDLIKREGIPLYCLNIKGPLSLISGLFRLNKILKREKPVVIMSWLYHADLVALISCLLLGLRKKLIWNLRCSKIDFRQYAYKTRIIVRCLASLSTYPSAIIYNSEAVKREHIKNGYRNGRWAYLPNGFSPTEWKPSKETYTSYREKLGIPSEAVIITMIGRFDPAKDYDTFLASAQIIIKERANAYFLCVGRMTEKLVIPENFRRKILLLGPRTDIPAILQASDIMVLSSKFGEGFPNVVGEAMLSGVPCVATNVWDARTLIQDTGIVVPPANTKEMVDAINQLINEGQHRRRARGEKAREIMVKNYNIEHVYRMYEALFFHIENETWSKYME